ncbi:MAG TPA: hypothetical protein VH475_28200 [Tepidisphaeraceae bacterium]|jgi:hypothetical protein
MRRGTTVSISIFLICGSAVISRAQIATPEELHRLVYDDRNYAVALQRITAALGLKGSAAKSVDRYDLYLLKAECHLQTKAAGLATEAYTAAAREAPNDADRAVAAAHALLLKQSRAFAYMPKTSADKTRPAPIDLLDRESRKRAFLALYLDELTAAEPLLATAKSAKSLGPIAAACPTLAKLEGIERAGTGDVTRTRQLRDQLTETTKKTVADALRGLAKQVGVIDKEANTFVEFYEDRQDPTARFPRVIREKAYKKKGLNEVQTNQLQEVNRTCDQIPPALAELAQKLGAQDKAFDPQSDEAARIRREVDRILDTDYLKVYRELPKK